MDKHGLQCIVIGAGAAGLAAAATLHTAGVHVAILEANSRIGEHVHCSQLVVDVLALGLVRSIQETIFIFVFYLLFVRY
jgi:flavin-dependent dehydrogenase